ncbi:hypothetical protein CIHG_01878 [Coccidioides immitis H538.4]|uniref:Uncharacterized protein n=2 Tax=Coccidioides immitis TaxID=5501 RepID=A0A0J8RGQ8_COCIT|nr:hypothetical protein CIRG_06201 [Coccidioides immitis RMSCC 2394]KMU84092.1 hypothetical protein CIHG_01878 [Coccidioides immitis H538.4]
MQAGKFGVILVFHCPVHLVAEGEHAISKAGLGKISREFNIRRRIVRQSRHGESSARACHLLQMFPPSNSAVQVHGNPPSPVPSYINRGFNVKSTMVIAEESELYAPRDLFAVPMTMSLCPFSHWFV